MVPTGATNGQIAQFNGTRWVLTTAASWPKGFISGLGYRYSSVTDIIVEPGVARNDANDADLTLASDTPLSFSTLQAIGGLDEKSMSGTVSVTSGNDTITGTGTAFLTEFGTRSPTHTNITFTNGSQAITGSGTKFLSEIAPGDLLGNTTANRYVEVESVESDTALTIAVTWPGVTQTVATAKVIEYPLVRIIDTGDVRYVSQIDSDTAATVSSNFSATDASSLIRCGVEGWAWYYVWLVSGGSGTGCILSTQRTTPFGVSGYTTSKRLLGCVYNDSALNIAPFVTVAAGAIVRQYARKPDLWAMLAGGTATSFTRVLWPLNSSTANSQPTPPIAVEADITMQNLIDASAVNDTVYVLYTSLDGTNIFDIPSVGIVDNSEHRGVAEARMRVSRANGTDRATYYKVDNGTYQLVYAAVLGWGIVR